MLLGTSDVGDAGDAWPTLDRNLNGNIKRSPSLALHQPPALFMRSSDASDASDASDVHDTLQRYFNAI